MCYKCGLYFPGKSYILIVSHTLSILSECVSTMILKNSISQAGYQSASYGILVSNYLATMLLEKVELLTRQQPCKFHIFRIKTTNNYMSFCIASAHFGLTISCLKTNVWFILFHIKREEINSGQIHQHRKTKSFLKWSDKQQLQ